MLQQVQKDPRIHSVLGCTFLLCLIPLAGIFFVAVKVQKQIDYDEGQLETTCKIIKFSRFEQCCTENATPTKMTIMPGDGFKGGKYESCIPDGYYTHSFVTADACAGIHLSPKSFDAPVCLSKKVKAGDTFQCYAACHSKSYITELKHVDYNQLTQIFFLCAFGMLIIALRGVYLVVKYSRENCDKEEKRKAFMREAQIYEDEFYATPGGPDDSGVNHASCKVDNRREKDRRERDRKDSNRIAPQMDNHMNDKFFPGPKETNSPYNSDWRKPSWDCTSYYSTSMYSPSTTRRHGDYPSQRDYFEMGEAHSEKSWGSLGGSLVDELCSETEESSGGGPITGETGVRGTKKRRSYRIKKSLVHFKGLDELECRSVSNDSQSITESHEKTSSANQHSEDLHSWREINKNSYRVAPNWGISPRVLDRHTKLLLDPKFNEQAPPKRLHKKQWSWASERRPAPPELPPPPLVFYDKRSNIPNPPSQPPSKRGSVCSASYKGFIPSTTPSSYTSDDDSFDEQSIGSDVQIDPQVFSREPSRAPSLAPSLKI